MNLLKRIVIGVGATTIVILVVAFVTAFIAGYRFDVNNGQVEHYSLLQFGSTPSGATVKVNDKTVSMQTPNKSSVSAGKYTVTMQRDGYDDWTKTVDIKAGVLWWLNYTLLVPKKLVVEPVATYPTLATSLASPDGRYMLIQPNANQPLFNLVNLSSDTISSAELTLPSSLYSGASIEGTTHVFQVYKWDISGRYVLVKHIYGDKDEWLLLDTQDISLSKNITKLFDIAITNIEFDGSGGNNFYALTAGDIRKLSLSAGTISKALISGVSDFSVFGSGTVTYTSQINADNKQQVVGLYRDGDDKPYVLRTLTNNDNRAVHIATARYFNEDYVAISEGKTVDVFGGNYPSTANDIKTSLKKVASYTVNDDIQHLSFSPTGEYVFTQSGADFSSYDLEYQLLNQSTISGSGAVSELKWLNDNYVWSDHGGSLTIREFDGLNVHTINPVIAGQGVTLTSNGRFLYSLNQTANGYQLQRVRMILP